MNHRPPIDCTHEGTIRFDCEPECGRCGRVGRVYPCGLGRSQIIWHFRGEEPTFDEIMVHVRLPEPSALERALAR